MSYIIDRTIQTYIDEERERCLALAKAIQHRPFLFFCIKAPYSVAEIDTARQRYEEHAPAPKKSSVEDLM